MSDRLTRKEIKHDIQQDEFVATVGRGVDYAQHHVRQLLLAVAGLVVLGAILLGGRAWLAHRGDAAHDALAQATRLLEAPIDSAAPKPDDAQAPTFASAEARRARAKAAFEAVVAEHGGSDPADVARLHLAGIAVEEGQPERARELWQAYLGEHSEGLLAAAARVSLWNLDRQQGKGEAVAAELRTMLEDADRPLPEDVLLDELAKTLDQLGKPDEAKAARQRILDEFPRSAYRDSAQRQLGGSVGGNPALGI